MNWRGVGLTTMAILTPATAAAQSPIAISSQVETGWTSNATDSAAGEADFYVSHTHDMSLTGETENFLLRGSLSISQTRFQRTEFENDAALAGGIEAQWALGSDAALRLGYAVTRNWTGDDLAIAGLVVPVQSVATGHEYLAELTVAGAAQQATVTVLADWTQPGDSVLGGLGLPPLRLEPEVGSVTGRLAWERALGPTVAALAGMEAWFTLIAADEQLTYLRAPADGGRLSAGLRLKDGTLALEGRGGIDLVWPKGLAELTRTLPYVSVAAGLTPVENVTLAATAETGVELADPLDGVAGRTIAVDLNMAWALAPSLTLKGGLASRQQWGLFDDSLARTSRTATLGVAYAVAERLDYGATLSWGRHDDPGESYDKTGIAVWLSSDL